MVTEGLVIHLACVWRGCVVMHLKRILMCCGPPVTHLDALTNTLHTLYRTRRPTWNHLWRVGLISSIDPNPCRWVSRSILWHLIHFRKGRIIICIKTCKNSEIIMSVVQKNKCKIYFFKWMHYSSLQQTCKWLITSETIKQEPYIRSMTKLMNHWITNTLNNTCSPLL